MEILDSQDGIYETKNTPLAAYLYMLGYPLLDVNISKFPSVFIFENSVSLTNCTRDWQVARAEGNLVLFYEAYRKCLKMTHVGKL